MRYLIISFLFIVASSCGNHNDSFPERLEPGAEAEDAVMADPSMRIDCDALRLSYDKGGIIFRRSTDGVISGVRLSDAAAFDYDPAKPKLLINGVAMELKEAEIIKHTGVTEWHRCISRRGDKIYIVVSGL